MGVREQATGFGVVGLAAALLALTASAPAAGATKLGTDVAGSVDCVTSTELQTASPGGPDGLYTVPPPGGVITSWSHQAATTQVPTQFRFKVARPAGGNTFTIVAESEIEAPVAGALNTYPARFPVQAGDVIGFFNTAGRVCIDVPAAAGYINHASGNPGPDVPAGTTTTFSGPFPQIKLSVSAMLEPDADDDGFGDETQDQCPTNAAKQKECVPPDTTITKGPKAKTRKKTTSFEFSAGEPGASFECSLDDGPFAACSSPYTVKVKRGRHNLRVRATDTADNTDGTPAVRDWKVKRKRKRR